MNKTKSKQEFNSPWKLKEDKPGFVITESDNRLICHIRDRRRAALIAAAPELLEACFDAYRELGDANDIGKKLWKAIAKAEGGR